MTEPVPLPADSSPAATRDGSSSARAVPPMPSEVTNVRTHRLGADSRLRRAAMPLRRMMRRGPRPPVA